MKYYIYLTTFPDGKVYCGKHIDNGDPYIGSGNYVEHYKTDHPNWRQMLKEGIIKNEVLELCTAENLNQKEIEWIAAVRNTYGDRCVNIADGGQGGNMGEEWSKRQKEAASAFLIDLWHNPEFRELQAAVQSANRKKKWQDPEYRERHIAATSRKFCYLTPDGTIRMMDRLNAGRHHPDWLMLPELTEAYYNLKEALA